MTRELDRNETRRAPNWSRLGLRMKTAVMFQGFMDYHSRVRKLSPHCAPNGTAAEAARPCFMRLAQRKGGSNDNVFFWDEGRERCFQSA
jgi:hypothetical protein